MTPTVELERRIESALTIPDKKMRVVSFKLWPNQRDYIRRVEADDAPTRRVHLKPRQVGESSIIIARNATHAMSTPNFTILVICQDKPTRELFRFHYKHHLKDYQRRGIAPHVGTDNEDMLEFDILGSRILFETAEGQGVGRAWTVNRLHASEVAHWKHPAKTLTGALQSVPTEGEVDIESTPYGAGGPFHRCVQAALKEDGRFEESHWELFFYPWWGTAEYMAGDDSPIDNLTDHEKRLMEKHGLTYSHIRWRRGKEAELAVAGEPFEQEYPEDTITCFLSGRSLVLRPEVIKEYLSYVREPVERVNPRDPEKPGQLWVWKRPRGPQKYLIPADISEGIGEDYFAAAVLDYLTLEVVAAYYDNHTDPVEAAAILDGMGRWYNNALIAPEVNGIGYATGKSLEHEWNYPNLYYRIDPRTGQVGDVGWKTDSLTRPLMQAALMDHLPTSSVICWDERAVNEMGSLVWERKNPGSRPRMEAVPGEYDDYMVMLSIGLVVRELIPSYQERPAPQPARRKTL